MGILSRAKVATETETERRWREGEEAHAELERLAGELVPEVTAEQAAWAVAFETEHRADVAGYSFDCKRHGDFLALFIAREGGPTRQSLWYDQPRKIVTAINLGRSREIKLTPGHNPDRNGEVRWYTSYENRHTAVRKPELYVPYNRPLVRLDPEPNSSQSGPQGMVWGGGEYVIRTKVPDVARAAEDDCIRFEGAGATLCTPAGLGEGVYQRILQVIAGEQ